ncbi:hypothetical protein ABPG74_014315 [Tetrahymena malaccensis]
MVQQFKNIFFFWIIVLANLIYGAERILFSELNGIFTKDDVKWVSDKVNITDCETTDLSEFSNQSVLGFYGLDNQYSKQTFSNLPPHWSISVRFDLILYQSLDGPPENDTIYVKINGNTDSYLKLNPGGGIYSCKANNKARGWGDELVLYYRNFTHSESSIEVYLDSKTNEDIAKQMNVYHATLHAQIVKVLQKATVQIVSKCSSCASDLIYLNNSCLNECPQDYYTVQQDEGIQCFECHRYCKLGCTGPLKEDCDSIKYQYQIIVFIFVGKSTLWIVSSIVGYFLDKKQSKICNSIINSPRIDPNNEKFPKANLKQKVDNRLHIQNLDQDYQQKQNDNQNKENEFEKQSNELNQEQNNQEENQIQNFLEQIMQMQVTTKNVITRKNNQSSFQVLEYQQTDQESKHQYQSKISSQIMPTIGTIANLNQINNQQAIDNQEEEKDTSQQQSYAADNKFKFTILGNEWVSLFYFYDPQITRFTRAILIFLKYQAFFLSSELVYSNSGYLLIVALLVSILFKQALKTIQSILLRKSMKFLSGILFTFILSLSLFIPFWFVPQLRDLYIQKDRTWSFYYGLLLICDFLVLQQVLSFFEYIFTIKYLNSLNSKNKFVKVYKLLKNNYFIQKIK